MPLLRRNTQHLLTNAYAWGNAYELVDINMEWTMTVTVHISGEGIEFEREVPESVGLQIMELSISDGADADDAPEDVAADEEEEEHSALPSNFFNRLSDKQEAMTRVLLNADEQLTSTELRRRISDEYNEEIGGGRGLAGIIAGFTRKYGDDFDLIKVDWGDGEGLYQLNPDRPEYIAELEEYFGE